MYPLSHRHPPPWHEAIKPVERRDTAAQDCRSPRRSNAIHTFSHLRLLSAPMAILLTSVVSLFLLLSSVHLASSPSVSSPSPAPLPDHVGRFHLQRSNVSFQRVGVDGLSSVINVVVDGQVQQMRSSLLSTLQNYGSFHSYHHTFHSQQFNQPALPPADDTSSSHNPAMSNRAIGHSFPTPLPHLLAIFGSSLAMGVFTSNAARMELMMDTFGRYLPASHILCFVPDTEEMRLSINSRQHSNVYVLSGGASNSSFLSHSADHHVLQALRTLVHMRPDAPFYYLCDDDTFPVISRIASYLHRFYHDTMYAPADKLFLGERTLKLNGKVRLVTSERELDVMVDYHPAAGGLLLNNALATALEPHTTSCPLLSTWDLTLAYCMDLFVPDHHLIDLPLECHLDAQSMDSTTLSEAEDVHCTLAYADMRQTLAEFGGGTSEEVHWRETELRSYSSYILLAEELVSELQVDVEAERHEEEATVGRRKHRLASLSPSISAPVTTLASPLRILLINSKQGDSRYNSLSALVHSMMRQFDLAPLALLTQLDWDVSYVTLTGPPVAGCRRCDLYHRPECAGMYVDSAATLVPHIQHQTIEATEANMVLDAHAVRLDGIDFGAYDIVISLDAVLPPHITRRNVRPLYAHYLHSGCDHGNKQTLTLPAPGYNLYLHPHLSQLDLVEADERTIHFPASLLYHGVFQSLFDLPSAQLNNRSFVTVLVGVDEAYELSAMQMQVLTAVMSRTGLSEYRTVTPVVRPQSDVVILTQSRLCLLLPGLLTASLNADAAQRRGLISHLLHAIAAGCLVIVTGEVATYTVVGEHSRGDGEDGSLQLLLSPQTIVANQEALMSALSMATDRSWVEREVGHQRAALNAHMMEKPLHSLLDAYTQHNVAKRVEVSGTRSSDFQQN